MTGKVVTAIIYSLMLLVACAGPTSTPPGAVTENPPTRRQKTGG